VAVSSPPGRAEEAAEKLARVRAFLDTADLDAALFTDQRLVAWVTGGLEDVIVRGGAVSFLWALVTREGAYLLTQNIEGPRVIAEEAPGALGFEVVEFAWETEALSELVTDRVDPARLANDGDGPGTSMVAALQELRLPLARGERERLRSLALDASGALESAMHRIRSGMTERELAAEIAAGLERSGSVACVLLVGSDERRERFRHPTVSAKPIVRDALAVIVAVRGGLNVACTRTASIGPTDPTLLERHRTASAVEASMIGATRPGVTYGQALQSGVDTYERLGYPDEWRHHYQGGPVGYDTREFGPTPLSVPNAFTHHPIAVDHACAWNPTVQGAKSEDTFIVGPDGPELVTNVSDWPMETHDAGNGRALPRPAILEL
jgi:Xaa-Pro dipeptidase